MKNDIDYLKDILQVMAEDRGLDTEQKLDVVLDFIAGYFKDHDWVLDQIERYYMSEEGAVR